MARKPVLDDDSMGELEDAYRDAQAMAPGPERERVIAALKRVQARLVEQYDIPPQAIPVDAHLLGLMDYGTGLARTIPGEIAVGAKALYDKATTGEAGYDPWQVADRLASAVIPFGEPAQSTGQYLERLGVPELGRLSDTYLGQKMGIERGSMGDITGRGVLGFAGDVGISPKMLKAGVDKLRKAEEVAQPTARAAAESTAAAREAARAKGAPGAGEWLKGMAKGLGELVVDPQAKIARAMHDWRFRFADEAARLKGKPLPSQIMWDANLSGITSGGIRADMEKVLAGNEAAIDDLLKDPQIDQMLRSGPNRLSFPRGSKDDFDYTAEPTLRFDDPATGDITYIGPSQMQEKSVLSPLYSAKQRALEQDLVRGEGAQAARASMEKQFRAGESANPSFQKMAAEEQARAGMPHAEVHPVTGQAELFDVPPHEVTRPAPQVKIGGVERPFGPDKTSLEGGVPHIHGVAPEVDPLAYDRGVHFDELRNIRRGAQGELKARNWYNRRTQGTAPYYPGDPKNMPAEAALWGDFAENAANLEQELIDMAKPGAGGKYRKINQDTSAILEGAPWLDRAPKTGATRRSQMAFSPFEGRLMNAIEDTSGAAAMLGSKALRSPWTRYGAAPVARSLWLENYWQRQAEESPDNPYALIYKYGAER